MIRLRKAEVDSVLNGKPVTLFRQLGHPEQTRLCKLSQGKPIKATVTTGGIRGRMYTGTIVAVHDKRYHNGECVYGVSITVSKLEEADG